MRKFDFYQLDVFTDKAFTGNALAVFPEAGGLGDDEMQKIAREMNLSETVFVFPSDMALRRLRIFTPMRELPLAGHPVVGTWNLLAQLGVTQTIVNGSIEIEQELNVGILPVEIEFQNSKPVQVTMTQAKFEAGETVSADAEIQIVVDGLGLNLSDLAVGDHLPIQIVSTGIKALVIPLNSLDAMSRCRINSSLLAEAYLAHGAIGCYAFTFETKEENSKVHTRFFAPDDNIAEDPATGSAAGSLSGYLVHHGAVVSESKVRFTIEQGDFMNRPSRIFAEVIGTKGNVEKVKIGGSSVIVAKGELFFD
jgi:trans-2,3-dihydro-3-hydroxyanthranilate isomerase